AFGVVLVIAIVFFLIFVFVKLWPWLQKMVKVVDDLQKLPDFYNLVKTALTDIVADLRNIRKEVNFNDGSSIKDALQRIETRLDTAENARDGIREDLQTLAEKEESLEQLVYRYHEEE